MQVISTFLDNLYYCSGYQGYHVLLATKWQVFKKDRIMSEEILKMVDDMVKRDIMAKWELRIVLFNGFIKSSGGTGALVRYFFRAAIENTPDIYRIELIQEKRIKNAQARVFTSICVY
jgi:hypothetical protein